MRSTFAIMQRELASLFFSPIAYVVLAGFLLATGVVVVFFTNSFKPGQAATLREFFQWMPVILAFFLPAISMRLISEEYRSGTIEPLMTAPLSDAQMVIGKYLASVAFYGVMVVTTLVYLCLLAWYGKPDIGASLAAYLGLLLVGASFLAFGLFASSLTRYQIVAWIIGAIALEIITLGAWVGASYTEGLARTFLQQINVLRHLDQFNRGLLTSESIMFFVATSALFVFLSIKVVESKRWR
jgi:ABC-2 type transport system permease protein